MEPDGEAVVGYLRKMGFRESERLFREEFSGRIGGAETIAFQRASEQDAGVSGYLAFHAVDVATANESLGASEIEKAFESLRAWASDSLDCYRCELLGILFPVAIHLYLEMAARSIPLAERSRFLSRTVGEEAGDHGIHGSISLTAEEFGKFLAVGDGAQVRDSSTASLWRTSRYVLSMSQYAYRLLLSFLQEEAASSGTSGAAAILILKIVNQFIHIRIVSESTAKSTLSVDGITGMEPKKSEALNKKSVFWGVHYPIDPSMEEALQDRNKREGGNRLSDVLLHGPLGYLKRAFANSAMHAPPRDQLAPKSIPPSIAETNSAIDRLRSLAKRALLATPTPNKLPTLPSILMYTLSNARDSVSAAEFSPCATILITAHAASYIDVWSLNQEPLRAVKPSIELAAMDIDQFSSLDIFREPQGSSTKRLVGHCGPVYAARMLNPEGHRLMVSASQDGTARLWSLDTYSCITVFRGHRLPIWDVDVAPLGAGPYFVTGGADRTARLWCTENVQPLRIFAGHLSDVEVVRFHPNGNYILSGSSDRTIRMWDVQTGACVRILTQSSASSPISALSVTPDGRFLISGDRSGAIRVWDLADARLLRTILQPEDTSSSSTESGATESFETKSKSIAIPYTIDFDRDGRIMATGGSDFAIRLWDLAKLTANSGVNNASNPTDSHSALLATYPTKYTSTLRLHFTTRNVLLCAGLFQPPSSPSIFATAPTMIVTTDAS